MTNVFNVFMDYMEDIIVSFGTATNYLFTSYEFAPGFAITPILLISFGGLMLYLSFAIPKWFVS